MPKRLVFSLLATSALLLTIYVSSRGDEETQISSVANLTGPQQTPEVLSDIYLEDHPRLFITQKSLINVQQKLSDPIYAADVKRLKNSKNPTDQALVYMLWGDVESGKLAKQALLKEGKIPRYKRMEKFIGIVQLAVMYDWLYPLLSEKEKVQVQKKIRQSLQGVVARRNKNGIEYYLNDDWARGAAFETIAVLALAGDAEWATEQLLKVYTQPTKYFSPYRGGAIDTLRTLSLSSGGGDQAGGDAWAGSGYQSMFLLGAGLFVSAWGTATGEDLWLSSNYFEKLPFYLTYAYLHASGTGEIARQVLEYGTGRNSEDSAALSKWLLEKQGRARGALAFRLLLGDLPRVKARSPVELGLPPSAYIEGADVVVSRSGWEESATAVFLTARHWDTSRFEPESGLLAIYKGGEPIMVRGVLGKSGSSVTNTSGIWMWNEREEIFKYGTHGSTYWRAPVGVKIRRALTAAPVLNGAGTAYQPETLVEFSSEPKGATVAETSFAKLLAVDGVKEVRRKVKHHENSIVVEDFVAAKSNIRVLVGYRLVEEPVINGNSASTERFQMEVSSTPASKIYWSGGVGKELIGPTGQWHGKRKGGFVEGYGKEKSKVRQYGLGYLFIEPVEKSDEYNFSTSITIK